MEKRLAIVGAGISGLLACKYAVAKGLNPVVYEAEEGVGGVWNCTVESTKLQNPRPTYEFLDFPWPCSVEEMFPNHSQVLEYLQSYAKHFGLFAYIKFNSKVNSLDYVGESNEEMEAFHLWGGTGKPFQSKGKWHLVVQDTKSGSTQVCMYVCMCVVTN